MLSGTIRGDMFVVERHGEPVAALVPIEVLEQWKRSRQEFFDELGRMAEGAGVAPEEADDLVRQEVAAVRAIRT